MINHNLPRNKITRKFTTWLVMIVILFALEILRVSNEKENNIDIDVTCRNTEHRTVFTSFSTITPLARARYSFVILLAFVCCGLLFLFTSQL